MSVQLNGGQAFSAYFPLYCNVAEAGARAIIHAEHLRPATQQSLIDDYFYVSVNGDSFISRPNELQLNAGVNRVVFFYENHQWGYGDYDMPNAAYLNFNIQGISQWYHPSLLSSCEGKLANACIPSLSSTSGLASGINGLIYYHGPTGGHATSPSEDPLYMPVFTRFDQVAGFPNILLPIGASRFESSVSEFNFWTNLNSDFSPEIGSVEWPAVEVVFQPPIITAGQTASGKVGTAFSKTFSLTDSANRPVTGWSATGLPAGLAINASTGAITGTPQDTGSTTITLTATGPGGTDTETATISIAVGEPSITAGQSFSGKVGETFVQVISLDDAADRPVTSWSVYVGGANLPAGLVLNTTTGAITGTPTAKGSFTASFTATGGGGTSSATSISFTISEGAPIITAGQSASGKVGMEFLKIFSLTDSTNRPATSWSATGLPSWATLNTATGAITGTPQDSGSTTISLTATGPGGTDTETAVISIAVGPPIITAGQSFSGKVGVAFVQVISLDDAADRPADSYWEKTGGTIPAGLTLNTTTGAITGTPTAKGSFTASFTATGGGGTSSATSISFTISEGAPIITAGQSASGKVGTAFSKTFSLTDSTNRPVTSWAATGLPSWATLNTTTGAITGTPQDSGTATITLTATGPGGTDTETATISIAVGPPIITLGQSFTGKVGVAFASATLTLDDALDRPVTSWSVTGLPAGLSLNTATGAITGAPTAKGSFTASFTATGAGGTGAATSAFVIADGAPIIVVGQSLTLFKGGFFKRDVRLADEQNRPVSSWSVSGALWAAINKDGEIFGTPPDAGDYVLEVTAVGPGGADTESLNVVVRSGSKLLFQIPVFAGAPGVANDLLVRGGEYLFARWTGKGAIPPGMNWAGMDEGLRFWGTPTRVGQWEAEFEGPYPPNFHSDLTVGGSDRLPLQLDAGDMPEEIVVSKFVLQFEVVEQEGYAFGQVLKELYSNPSMTQTARRQEWSGTRCIGARGFSRSVAESGVATPVNTDVAAGLDSVATNLAAKVNESGLATAVASGTQLTITALEVGILQISAGSTKSGSISVASVSQGSTTAWQISTVTLSGSFTGGVAYSVSLGGVSYTVTTEAPPKAGLWHYAAAGNAADAEGVTARGLRNDDLIEDDLVAGDWVFSEPVVIDRGFGGCLMTGGISGRSLLDGVRRSVAVNAVIAI